MLRRICRAVGVGLAALSIVVFFLMWAWLVTHGIGF